MSMSPTNDCSTREQTRTTRPEWSRKPSIGRPSRRKEVFLPPLACLTVARAFLAALRKPFGVDHRKSVSSARLSGAGIGRGEPFGPAHGVLPASGSVHVSAGPAPPAAETRTESFPTRRDREPAKFAGSLVVVRPTQGGI